MGGWVYVLANGREGTLHVGVTAHLAQRAWEHREGLGSAFTRRHGVKRLVHAERHEPIEAAIQREKTVEHRPRAWKVALIVRDNPDWGNLYDLLA